MRTLDDILTKLRALQPDLRRRYPIRNSSPMLRSSFALIRRS